MPILIDTSFLILAQKKKFDVQRFIIAHHPIMTCDAVRAEFRVGIHAPKDPKTINQTRIFWEKVVENIPSYEITQPIFDAAGDWVGKLLHDGFTVQMIDAIIASVAIENDLPVATCNERDFNRFGVKVINPLKDFPVNPLS